VVVVIVDILFVRHNTAERWMVNIGIVAVFAAFGFLVFRDSTTSGFLSN
jgi:hypothetical protein